MKILHQKLEHLDASTPIENTLKEKLIDITRKRIYALISQIFELMETSSSEIIYIQLNPVIATELPYARIENIEYLLEVLKKLLQNQNIFLDDELKQLVTTGEIPLEYFSLSCKIASATKTFIDYISMDYPEISIGYVELALFKEAEAEISKPHICIKVHIPLKDFKEVSRLWDMTVDYLQEKFNEDDLEEIELFFTRL